MIVCMYIYIYIQCIIMYDGGSKGPLQRPPGFQPETPGMFFLGFAKVLLLGATDLMKDSTMTTKDK